MSDPNDAFHRTPLSSSSTNTSGTQALSVTVDPEPAGQDAAVAEEANISQAETAANENSSAPHEPSVDIPETESAGTDVPDQADMLAVETPQIVTESPYSHDGIVASQETSGDPVSEAAGLAAEAAAAAPSSRGHNMTHDLRAAVRQTIAQNEAKEEQMLATFEKATVDFKSAMDDARNDAARLTFKLMEFAHANMRNNIELARDYASARSVPDIVNVQTAYFKRQMDLVNRQTAELQKLTVEIASKKAAQFQLPIHRS
ncbi:MAG: hypothetical protein HC850_15725 [Rhodomicrobium sp.]|nr:hypothetical protein [Rhodomicrobium sp.]